MDNGIQFVEATAFEGDLGKPGAVEAAVGPNDIRTECADNLTEDILTGFHHLAAQGIGLKDVSAEFPQKSGDSAFATAEAAG
jgi:hypothetical protein